jgi:hypothetical protein
MPKEKGLRDTAGNSVASAAAFDRELARIGAILLKWEQAIEALEQDEVLVTGMNVQTPTAGRADYLLVVRAWAGGRKLVTFCSGDTLHSAIGGFVGRQRSGTILWKDDQYAK